MDLRNLALGRLVFLTLWATVCGPISGLTMGMFFLVYDDGYRKGVLAPEADLPLLGRLDSVPAFASLASRFSGQR